MQWYVIHTKPRQEHRALLNLEQQNYECYLPMLNVEKLQQGKLTIISEPLFPRYLFIHLDANHSSQSWSPIRSTKGVSRLVTFGNEAAKIDGHLVETIRAHSNAISQQPQKFFTPGERLLITEGPFEGIEAIFHMSKGESRAMVLIELLSKPTLLQLAPKQLRKIN